MKIWKMSYKGNGKWWINTGLTRGYGYHDCGRAYATPAQRARDAYDDFRERKGAPLVKIFPTENCDDYVLINSLQEAI